MKKSIINEINIDLNYTKKLGITPQQYVLAYLINFKDKDRYIEIKKLYLEDCLKEDLHNLIIKGYLFGGNKENMYDFTFDKSKINGIFDTQNDTTDSLSWEELVSQFRDTFPSGTKSGGFYVKSSKRDIEVKLKKFIKDYKYPYDVILKAVKNYVEQSKENGYQYMKIAHYFILKNGESMLASYCDAVEEGVEEKKPSSIFMDKL